MDIKMGICALCKQPKILQNSHLIPRWVYKRLLQVDPKGKPPIWISDSTAYQTSKQITQYLLCEDCEARFSKRENYVAQLAVLKNGAPQILQSITRCDTPRKVLSVLGNDIDSAQIVYFASSIFWRACVMRRGCKLGAYESQLRSYLLEEIPFPPCAILTVSILETYELTDHPYHEINPYVWFNEPASSRGDGCWIHGFILCGLVFRCFIGKALPEQLKQICLAGAAPKKYVSLLYPDKSGDFLKALDMIASAKPCGNLAETKA